MCKAPVRTPMFLTAWGLLAFKCLDTASTKERRGVLVFTLLSMFRSWMVWMCRQFSFRSRWILSQFAGGVHTLWFHVAQKTVLRFVGLFHTQEATDATERSARLIKCVEGQLGPIRRLSTIARWAHQMPKADTTIHWQLRPSNHHRIKRGALVVVPPRVFLTTDLMFGAPRVYIYKHRPCQQLTC